jgi:hypothetical protein
MSRPESTETAEAAEAFVKEDVLGRLAQLAAARH